MVSDPVFDAFQPAAIAAPDEQARKKVLRDANEYIARQHFSISLLSRAPSPFINRGSKASTVNSARSVRRPQPQLLFFYPARFWFDQDLKKKMGH